MDDPHADVLVQVFTVLCALAVIVILGLFVLGPAR